MRQRNGWIWQALCIGLCLFLSFSCAWAQESKAKIRVGYANHQGFLERDEGRREGYSGYAYDYLEEIAQYTGWEYEFVYGTWEQCCERLKSGEIDLLGMLQATEERNKVYAFSRYPCGIEFAAIYVRADETDVFYEDYASFSKLRLALVRGFYQNESFERYARSHAFEPQRLYCSSLGEAKDALRRGEVDAVLGSSLGKMRSTKLVAKFAGNPFYFAAPKSKEAIVRQLDEAVDRIQLQKPHWQQQLFEKHYGRNEEALHLRREEAAFVEDAPDVRVTADPSFAPYSFLPANGQAYRGAFNETLHKLFGRLGMGHKPVLSSSFYAAAEAVKAGDADILAGVYPSKEFGRLYGMKFTHPYMSVKYLLVGRQGMTFSEGNAMDVAVAQEHLGMRYYLQERFPAWTVIVCDTPEACLQAVRNGTADVSLQMADRIMPVLLRRRYGDVVPILTVDAEIPVSIGVSDRMEPQLLAALDKAVATLHPQEINDSILRHTLGRSERATLQDFLRANALELSCAAALLLALAFAAVAFAKRRKNAEIAKLAFTDQLTGARNLRKFELDAARFLPPRGAARYALAYFDIDKFKFINETLGYARGNEVLRCFAQLFAQMLHKDELFARISDDRFIALLDFHGEARLQERLEAFCQEFGRLRDTLLERQRLVLAVGVYIMEPEDKELDAAMDRANLARKSVKGARSHSIAFYNSEIHAQVVKEKQIESIMEEALARREFRFYVQPKYALDSGAVVGLEALVRWLRPDGNLVSPGDFVPIFERNGFVTELDFYMFEEACRCLRQWKKSGCPPLPIAVNFSRLHLVDANFVDALVRIAWRYGVDPHYLEVEMTESAFVEEAANATELISRIKAAGFVLTMDDFGTGYSSLNLLREVPFDVLKLDKSFLVNKETTPRDRIMISSIVRMAKELDIRVVAEGIETEAQQQFVRETGCDMGQGYLFARPMPIEDFEAQSWKFETTRKEGGAPPTEMT